MWFQKSNCCFIQTYILWQVSVLKPIIGNYGHYAIAMNIIKDKQQETCTEENFYVYTHQIIELPSNVAKKCNNTNSDLFVVWKNGTLSMIQLNFRWNTIYIFLFYITYGPMTIDYGIFHGLKGVSLFSIGVYTL